MYYNSELISLHGFLLPHKIGKKTVFIASIQITDRSCFICCTIPYRQTICFSKYYKVLRIINIRSL